MSDFGFLNSIKDKVARDAIRRMLVRLEKSEKLLTQQLGVVSRPLDQHLDANSNLLTNVQDPVSPQDAVTKIYLQKYVASAFSNFTAAGGGGVAPPELPPAGPDDGIPDHSATVAAIHAAHGIGPGSSNDEVFRFAQDVAWTLANGSYGDPAGLVAGLCKGPSGGDNVFDCGGTTYRYNRVCYTNGHLFKILVDSDPGGARTPEWSDNGVGLDLYRVATSPSSPC